jgi:putative transposase
MANTFHYHFTFSTKNREPWIAREIETRVWAYIGGVARKHKVIAIQVGGIEDHIHALGMERTAASEGR